MNRRKYTEQDLIDAIKSSLSLRETMLKLKLNPKGGGGYISIRKAIKSLNINISHFLGKGSNKGKKFGFKRPIMNYLSNMFTIQSMKLKNRLLKEQIFKYECSSCKLSKWLGVPIPLELDHIDGDHENNFLANLRLLCPNCHALTPTYCRKNKNIKEKIIKSDSLNSPNISSNSTTVKKPKSNCIICSKEFSRKNVKYCSQECFKFSQRKVDWDKIDFDIECSSVKSMEELAKKLKCSSSAIRNHMDEKNFDWSKYFRILRK